MLRFALTIFVSAFLLFQVQPLIGRFILPWFGGGPSIWTGCMLFFQMALLGGYLYAHLICSWLPVRLQARVHLAVLGVSVLLLPIAPNDAWKPGDDQSPLLRIFMLLLATVGGPYFVLASTGPLMQKWFSQAAAGKSPYRLYALSNIGSLLALLSYPFVFEPWLTLQSQVAFWSGTYVVFAALAAACAWKTAHLPAFHSSQPPVAKLHGAVGQQTPAEQTGISKHSVVRRPSPGVMMLWLGLSASASAMLLATTNQLCIDVATVPFLWVLPLSVYLLSFIICFDRPQWYDRRVWGGLLLIFAALAAWAVANGANVHLSRQVLIFTTALFACCMTCHGELVQSRPHPRYLTMFYLLISSGGVLGGLFVAVVAPHVFTGYWEFHISLVACCLLTLLAWCSRSLWQTPPSAVFWTWFGCGLALCVMVFNWVWWPAVAALTGLDETVLLAGTGFFVLVGLIAMGQRDRAAVTVWSWMFWGLLPAIWVIGVGRYRVPDVLSVQLALQLAGGTFAALCAGLGLLRGMDRLTELWRNRVVWLLCASYGALLVYTTWRNDVLTDEQTGAVLFTVLGGMLVDRTLANFTWKRLPVPGAWCWAPLLALNFFLADELLRIVQAEARDVVYMTRNFYGVLQVEFEEADDADDDDFGMPASYRLMHGQIQHGFQYADEFWGRQPTTYYGPKSGLSLAIEQSRLHGGGPAGAALHAGIVGLGTGTIAAHGRAGDTFRFYEINPQVQDVAGRFFTYLKDSAAENRIVLGDARIVMERELGAGQSQRFHVLAIDAFSSDAIPVHLLTAECGDIYQQQLADGGILAIHISNRFLDLGPVVRGLAEHLQWQAVRIEDEDDDATGVFRSTWVLLTANAELAAVLEESPGWAPWTSSETVLLWTDDYSGLWPILDL